MKLAHKCQGTRAPIEFEIQKKLCGSGLQTFVGRVFALFGEVSRILIYVGKTFRQAGFNAVAAGKIVTREVKRAKLVARYAEKRAALKKIIATSEDPAEAYEAARALQAIPKNANPIRLHNRCKITGRPKGYMRQFGLSRIQFREMASSGLIPGVKKASW